MYMYNMVKTLYFNTSKLCRGSVLLSYICSVSRNPHTNTAREAFLPPSAFLIHLCHNKLCSVASSERAILAHLLFVASTFILETYDFSDPHLLTPLLRIAVAGHTFPSAFLIYLCHNKLSSLTLSDISIFAHFLFVATFILET